MQNIAPYITVSSLLTMVKNGDNTKGKQMDLGTEPLLEEFFTVKQL